MKTYLKTYVVLALGIGLLVFSAWAIGRAWDYTINVYNSPNPPQYSHTTN